MRCCKLWMGGHPQHSNRGALSNIRRNSWNRVVHQPKKAQPSPASGEDQDLVTKRENKDRDTDNLPCVGGEETSRAFTVGQ